MLNRLTRIPPWGIIGLALAGMLYLMSVRAWVSEDAYISFRVIENFMEGYGLRWNVHERVQIYTHPLWLLLQLPLRAVWNNLYHANIALSVVCSMAALVVALRTANRPAGAALALFLLPLALSKSFMDYTTSGLETPLCYLLYAVFGHVLLRLRGHPYFWLYLSLSVSLALVNRFDTVILYAPTLLYLAALHRRDMRWDHVLLGAIPLALWCYFALFYYGFLFPNTKYAKLDTGLPLALYLQQSMNYLKHLFMFDLPGLIVLFSSVLFIFRRNALAACIALGVYLYFLYVLYIGGDYMAGRFWALPIFVSAWLWYAFAPPMRPDMHFALACLLIAACAISPMLRDINKDCSNCLDLKGRIIDARHTFHRNKLVTGLYPLKLRSQGTYPFCRDGRKLAAKKPPVQVMFFVGMHAYCAGPGLKSIDMLGLGDALIARLPAQPGHGFYIGHFRRAIPKGYPYAVDTGFTNLMHPALAAYYDKLRLITSGDLWSRQRLKTIVLFNLGYYDHLRQEYLNAKE